MGVVTYTLFYTVFIDHHPSFTHDVCAKLDQLGYCLRRVGYPGLLELQSVNPLLTSGDDGPECPAQVGRQGDLLYNDVRSGTDKSIRLKNILL